MVVNVWLCQVLLFVCCAGEALTLDQQRDAIYSSSPDTKDKVIRDGHVIPLHGSSAVRSKAGCAVNCLVHPLCKGFNYNKAAIVGSTCELVDTNYQLQAGLLEADSGYTHYWMQSDSGEDPSTSSTTAAAVTSASTVTQTITTNLPVSDKTLIHWPPGCDQYNKSSTEKAPNITPLSVSTVTDMSQCQDLCTNNVECGGFAHLQNNTCRLLNINDKLISYYLSQNWYMQDDELSVWYSKTCPYDLGATNTSCNSYRRDLTNDNRYIPGSRWQLAQTGVIPNMMSGCMFWCTLHAGCKSFGKQHHSAGTRCLLYTSSIPELEAAGLGGDVQVNEDSDFNYTHHERMCT